MAEQPEHPTLTAIRGRITWLQAVRLINEALAAGVAEDDLRAAAEVAGWCESRTRPTDAA